VPRVDKGGQSLPRRGSQLGSETFLCSIKDSTPPRDVAFCGEDQCRRPRQASPNRSAKRDPTHEEQLQPRRQIFGINVLLQQDTETRWTARHLFRPILTQQVRSVLLQGSVEHFVNDPFRTISFFFVRVGMIGGSERVEPGCECSCCL